MKKSLLKSLFITLLVFSINISAFASMDSQPFKAGVEEYRQGNFSKAVHIMGKILEIEQDNYYAHYYMAISLVKLGQYEEAKKHYQIIIANANHPKLIEFAKNGLSLLDTSSASNNNEIIQPIKPQPITTIEKPNKPKNIVIEVPKETSQSTEPEIFYPNSTPKTEKDLNAYSNQINESLNDSSEMYTNNPQVEAITQQTKVSSEELNNLVQLLSKNPQALETLNKLAKSGSQNQGNMANKDFDPASIAKLMKAMMLNNQLSMLSNNNDEDKNNSSNDFINPMSGFDPMQFAMMGNKNNNMQMLMQYMNKNNNQQMNPNIMNMLLNQNALSGF